jgi:Arc/MetJ-type ribon-helix-helix transcriptional regulator
MSNIINSALRSLSERREARQQRKSLERELDSFKTRADILDFEATLDRYPDAVTRDLRVLVAAGLALRG